MSSSRPTSTEPRRPARWRTPAAWSLRTRIVAIMMVLLTVLGLVVGGTAEVFLHRQLYQQLDDRLDLAMHPPQPGGGRDQGYYPPPGSHGGGTYSGFNADRPFISAQLNDFGISYSTINNATAVTGGVVDVVTNPESNSTNLRYVPITNTAVLNKLLAVEANGKKTDITLPDYGSYRVVAENVGGSTKVIALRLSNTQSILGRVALVTGSAVLIALVIAGWAGALIVRGTLRPLRRVAATATRVSELRLDRGEVELAQRVPERDTDPNTEVGQVGNALNRMLDHVGNALEARHASEMQVRQFVADASHELRTPLAAIRGYAELSRRSRAPISEEIAHVLGRVESEAKRMTVLVEDLLLLARLDAGRPLAHEPVDLSMLVVDAVSDAHAAGPRHYWQLDVPDAPVTVIGDQQRLHQVLANLLANARTHTPEGTVVTVQVDSTPESAILHVIDGGPGIPDELQPHIFERFARGDSSRSRAAGSTGLGLSIVHAVVTAHGGTVSMQSAPGRTVFTVVLPMAGQPVVPAAGQFARSTPRAR